MVTSFQECYCLHWEDISKYDRLLVNLSSSALTFTGVCTLSYSLAPFRSMKSVNDGCFQRSRTCLPFSPTPDAIHLYNCLHYFGIGMESVSTDTQYWLFPWRWRLKFTTLRISRSYDSRSKVFGIKVTTVKPSVSFKTFYGRHVEDLFSKYDASVTERSKVISSFDLKHMFSWTIEFVLCLFVV